jgi:hypothetical protein
MSVGTHTLITAKWKAFVNILFFIPVQIWLLRPVVIRFTTYFPHTVYPCVCYDYYNRQRFCPSSIIWSVVFVDTKFYWSKVRPEFLKYYLVEFQVTRPAESELHWSVEWLAHKKFHYWKRFVLYKWFKYRRFVRSADCRVIQKQDLEMLKGSLKLDGSCALPFKLRCSSLPAIWPSRHRVARTLP